MKFIPLDQKNALLRLQIYLLRIKGKDIPHPGHHCCAPPIQIYLMYPSVFM